MDEPREHSEWGDPDQGAASWDAQYEHFLEQVSEHFGMDANELRNDDAYNEDYEAAFGLETGDNHLHGFDFSDPKEYAEFLADWLEYDHDEIDYWLGYGEDN